MRYALTAFQKSRVLSRRVTYAVNPSSLLAIIMKKSEKENRILVTAKKGDHS